MSDGRCATCKWWGDNVGESNYPLSQDAPEGWKVCILMTSDEDAQNTAQPIMRQTKAFAIGIADDSGFDFSGVATAPDFGCVQWEAKA